MERLVDKAIVLALCCAALPFGAEAPAAAVMLCVAVIASAACELASPTREGSAFPHAALRWVPCAVPLAYCALVVCVPAGAPFVPLALYDLSRSRWRALAAVPVLVLAVALVADVGAGAHVLAPYAPQGIAVTVVACTSAIALALRGVRADAAAARNRRVRDELSQRSQLLERKNRDLMDRQGYEIELATLSERARIAREIHDNVGHLLTRAVMQAEALRTVYEGEPRVQADFADLGATIADALDTVRTSVHDLRDDAVDLTVQIERTASHVARDTGVAVRADVAVERAPAAVATCLMSVVREAITNAIRHGAATEVHVRCLEHPAFYQLTIDDNGSGAAAASEADGMGVAAMRERVEGMGGSFQAGPRPAEAGGGFRVFATVPKPGAARSTAVQGVRA